MLTPMSVRCEGVRQDVSGLRVGAYEAYDVLHTRSAA